MPRPKLKTVLPLPLIAVLLFVQLVSPAPVIVFALVAMSGVLLASYLWARSLARNLRLERQRRYGWAQVGDVLEERFIVENRAGVPLLWGEARDFSDVPGYRASRAISCRRRGTAQWRTESICQKRGVYHMGPWQLYFEDPFGLFSVTLRHDRRDSFVIYPMVLPLPNLIEPHGLLRGSGRANVRSQERTTNASSVRQYAAGDALSHIHWRSTARLSMPGDERFYVKEFDREPSGDVWIILDMQAGVQVGQGSRSSEEQAVVLAASLAAHTIHSNQAVGLVCEGDQPYMIYPHKGEQHLWHLLNVLAAVRAEGRTPVAEVVRAVAHAVSPGMAAAIITPSGEADWVGAVGGLQRQGIRPLALLLDAALYGGTSQAGRLLEMLNALSVPARVVGLDLTLDFEPRSRQRPEYRALGTGRVIVVHPGDVTQATWVSLGDKGAET